MTAVGDQGDTKAARRASCVVVANYHEAQLAALIEHVREALVRYDAGEIDVFDLDDTIHHYKRSARELWKFCAGAGSHVLFAARTLEYWQAEGDLPDWWEAATPRRR